MEENNDNLSQNDSALPSSEKQGPKPKDTLKIATIVCAILAVAGISFGIYEAVQNSAKDKRILELRQLIEDDYTDNGTGTTTNDSDNADNTTNNSSMPVTPVRY